MSDSISITLFWLGFEHFQISIEFIINLSFEGLIEQTNQSSLKQIWYLFMDIDVKNVTSTIIETMLLFNLLLVGF